MMLLFLALFHGGAAAGEPWAEIVKKVSQAVVYIETEVGDEKKSCTGFVIDAKRQYVVSAAHCDAAKDGTLWVDRVKGKVISKDTKKDLLVIQVPDLDTHTALLLAASDPDIQEEVLSIGYGYGLERPFYRRANISDTHVEAPDLPGGPFIAIDAPFQPGQSGGPVVNANGEVVMIVQQANMTTGIGVGAKTLKDRTGRFWAKP
jgi:S1-C subfamily serine protease